MQKQLKITLNGKQYAISTDEHDEDVFKAAQLVDSLVAAQCERMPNISEDKIALMVALHVATDLAKMQRILLEDEASVARVVSLLSGAV